MKKLFAKIVADYLHSLPAETTFPNPNYHGEPSIRASIPVSEILEEIDKDATRGDAQRNAANAVYNAAHDMVMAVLKGTNVPLTAAEIFEEIAHDLPDFSKGQLVRGLTKNWADEVVKIDGKISTYRYNWETA